VLRPLAAPIRLAERVLAHPAWAETYRHEVTALLTNALNPERLLADAARLAELTRDAVAAESPQVWAAFQRSALGQTHVAPPPGAPPPNAGTGESAPLGPRPGPGPGFGRIEDIGFADWLTLRVKNVRDELDGSRSGAVPRLMRGPGGPRPPGRPQLRRSRAVAAARSPRSARSASPLLIRNARCKVRSVTPH
jgi:hypothetical protein